MAKPRLTEFQRFELYVSPEPNTGCHLWTGGLIRGYGCFHRKVSGAWSSTYAHRFAWEIAFGVPPPDLHVLHKCDVRPCVNPDHLFLGRDAENAIDKARKFRCPPSLQGLPFGVSWSKDRKRPRPYSAQVSFNKKHYYLGRFSCPQEAHAVAMEFKRQLYSGGHVDAPVPFD